MSLSVGIVGLPNVGKSTLFNALLKRQVALAANYPFATIEPNVGIVEVPDDRLLKLAETVKTAEKLDKLPPLKPATISFTDIAGLVAGAHKGEGLGNKFLSHIREVDLICHVLRAFEDDDVLVTGALDPIEDLMTVRMELILKDTETVDRVLLKARGPLEKENRERLEIIMKGFNEGKMANAMKLGEKAMELAKELNLITLKPEVFVVNLSEDQLTKMSELKYHEKLGVNEDDLVYINAQLESELASLTLEDQEAYLLDLGITQSGIDKMAKVAYTKLNLISFLTVGEIEAKAWTVRKGSLAPEAAGVIHTDFSKKFIKAQVIDYDDFVSAGGWKRAKELGKVRQEGRDYEVKDGDVIEFMIGS